MKEGRGGSWRRKGSYALSVDEAVRILHDLNGLLDEILIVGVKIKDLLREIVSHIQPLI